MSRTAWIQELREPTPGFREVYVHRVREAGLADTLRDLVERLPVSGDAALHSAQGLMVLRSILVLAPWLQEASWHGLLAAHLQAMAVDALPEPIAFGSGPIDFEAFQAQVAPDMANTGLKGILAHQLADLPHRLGSDRSIFEVLQAACGTLSSDFYWNQRALKRLDTTAVVVDNKKDTSTSIASSVQILCEGGLVATLDHFGALIREGLAAEAFMGILVEGAARKLLEAERELQGRTSWCLAYLATLPRIPSVPWLQAAALINLFPSEEWFSLGVETGGSTLEALREAMLDGEPPLARSLAAQLPSRTDPPEFLPLLAEVAASSDPLNDRGQRLLAVAAATELCSRIPPAQRAWLFLSLATFLAATQTSGDRIMEGQRAWLA